MLVRADPASNPAPPVAAPLTPGAYLRLRREAAGLSRDDLALRLETVPAVCAMRRAEWLRAIETDPGPVSISVAFALASPGRLHLDTAVLDALNAATRGEAVVIPPICRGCGCSEHNACADRCWWIAEDLCSSCAADVAGVPAI